MEPTCWVQYLWASDPITKSWVPPNKGYGMSLQVQRMPTQNQNDA